MSQLNFDSKSLDLLGQKYVLDFEIRDARLIGDIAVVIFKFTDEVPRYKQFRNCIALDKKGNHIWTAEHPTNGSADFYLEFMNDDSNKLWNFGCFVCELDFKTGRLKEAIFTK